MNHKVSKWKKIRIIFLISGIFSLIMGVYCLTIFADKDWNVGEVLSFVFAVLGATSFLFAFSELMGGYPFLTRNSIDTGGKIRVLSLFEVQTERGIPVYMYEIELPDGKTYLLRDKTPDLFNGLDSSYTMNRTEEWSKVSK